MRGVQSIRIGVMGGTFDPIHNAHLAAAQLFQERLALERIHFIPAGHPWQKPGVQAPGDARLEMLKLALEPLGAGFVIDERELKRPGASYSVDTLAELRAQYGPTCVLVFLTGSDQLRRLQTWSRWLALFDAANLGVVARAGYALDQDRLDPEVAAQVLARRVPESELPGALWQPAGQIALIEAELSNASSTRVRQLATSGDFEGMRDLVPSSVGDYIRSHLLYQN